MAMDSLRASFQYLPVTFAAVVCQTFIFALYIHAPRLAGETSALVCVAQDRVGIGPFRHVRVGFPSDGYDGQAYYVIAQDPWRKQDPAYIDKPSYRHMRLLYPALAWLLSGGDRVGLFWALPAVNLLAIGGMAALGAYFAQSRGRNRWWGLLLPFAVNAGMPALRDLTDPLATCTVLLLAVAWLQRWPVAILGLSALLAVFAREQNLAIVGIVVLLAASDRDWRRVAAMLVAMFIWTLWAATLWRVYHDSPFPLGNFGPPFAAMFKRLADPAGKSSGLPIHIFGLGCLIVQMFACLLIPVFRPERFTLLLAGAGVALAVVGSSAIYDDVHAYLRVFAWIPLALWLWAVQTKLRWPFAFTLPLLPWPLLAVAQVWKLS